ncbi:MAG: hypothetical protein AW07_02269 [Candidatus Accumulibacter sp. SK-11]|nr:MAG: hypothetical protein AW07_02269 [Candidatus Accumulibacter sp. SK-11]
MLATTARTVPDKASACGAPATGLQTRLPPSCSTVTAGLLVKSSEPSGPLTEIRSLLTATATPGGRMIGFLATRDMATPYATKHRTSPPTWLARALRSVITPLGVDTMATPRPFITSGISPAPR